MKWTASLIVNFAKNRWSPVRAGINTLPVFGVSRNETLLVDSGQDSVVLAQAFESLRFPLEQGESFSDLSCLTCARRAVRLASSVSNLTSPCRANLECERCRYYHDFFRTWTSKDKYKEIVALRSPTPLGNYLVFIAIKGGGRSTQRLPHAKMLLVPITFVLCWVNYALEGSTFSLSKRDFSPEVVSHWQVMAYTYQFTMVFVSVRQDLPPDARAFSLTSF